MKPASILKTAALALSLSAATACRQQCEFSDGEGPIMVTIDEVRDNCAQKAGAQLNCAVSDGTYQGLASYNCDSMADIEAAYENNDDMACQVNANIDCDVE